MPTRVGLALTLNRYKIFTCVFESNIGTNDVTSACLSTCSVVTSIFEDKIIKIQKKGCCNVSRYGSKHMPSMIWRVSKPKICKKVFSSISKSDAQGQVKYWKTVSYRFRFRRVGIQDFNVFLYRPLQQQVRKTWARSQFRSRLPGAIRDGCKQYQSALPSRKILGENIKFSQQVFLIRAV